MGAGDVLVVAVELSALRPAGGAFGLTSALDLGACEAGVFAAEGAAFAGDVPAFAAGGNGAVEAPGDDGGLLACVLPFVPE